jgi:hypothetical protein
MNDSFKDPTGSRILRAYSNPRDLWRTPRGIARETGLSLDTVLSYIHDHADLFRVSPIAPGGMPLYSIDSPLTLQSKLSG